MTHYGGKDLARSFRQVRGNTIQTAEDVPEDKYGFTASPDTRSIGATLAHIATSTGYQDSIQRSKATDLKDVNFMELFQKFSAEEAKPRTKAETIAYLKSQGEGFAFFLEGLSDEFLAESVAMPPGAEPATKTRLEMLLSPKEHEMHHRGQLMMLQRMVGLVPHLTRQMQERMAPTSPAS
jgi:uncharacterized damage-inducible protein DinB